MRCFIAIDIDQNTRAALRSLQSTISERANKAGVKKSDVKWVQPEATHLTLKFLGEVEDNKIAEVCDIVKEIAANHESFEIAIESVGCFGGRSARVLWVGTGEGKEHVHRLQMELEERLLSVGWPKESREFSAHLTLCRIRNSKAGLKLAQISEDYKNFKIGSIFADSISVYQSQLKPSGPVYIVLGNYKMS